jgi:hypothetical protein
MRKFLMVAMVAGVFMGVSHTAIANLFYPGRVIIGYGGGGGGGGGTNAAAMGGCVLAGPVDCECMPNMRVLDACMATGAPIQCLTPDMKYLVIEQTEPVLIESPMHTLGTLRCSGVSNETANVVLATPEGVVPMP